MPKYFDFKVCGYYLYFTNKCIIECMHVHASDKRLSEAGSAKFIVKGNGDTELMCLFYSILFAPVSAWCFTGFSAELPKLHRYAT